MNKFKIRIVLAILTACLPAVRAQQPNVTASIDSTVMLIGKQCLMHLDVSGPSNITYGFPSFQGDTLVTGIEILGSKLDTLLLEDGRIEMRADYLITSFDSGLYFIPPVKILAGTDTIESNYLGLKIMTYDVDTTKMEIFDIKGVAKPDFVLSDYRTEFFLFLLIYGLILLVIWLILRKKYRKGEALLDANVPQLPPHVVAIMELDRLRSEKIWKQGKNKQYYTELTDVIRKYIERRFQINAMEMTSEEILDLFRRDRDTQSVYQNLRQILQLADLVKFAKIDPLESDNELSIMNSYLFVNQTKVEEVKPMDEQKEELLRETDDVSEKAPEPEDHQKYQPK